MANTAIIFDIERFSTADGPGIRTSVFFKGCNLHCPWCHNAEGLDFHPQLRFDADKCIGCGACARICPQGAHAPVAGRHALLRERCDACMRCVSVCYSGALETVGREVTLDTLEATVLEDAAFYRRSGGGVTATGGEALCQADFVAAFFRRLKDKGIHTAVETNLSLPWARMEEALLQTALVMFDLKTLDDARHQTLIGCPSQTVQDNIRRLAHLGVPAIARTPVIPGLNDTPEAIRAIARFLKQTLAGSLLYYELLPYHPLGTGKAALLGLCDRVEPVAPPDAQTLQRLADAALAEGLSVRVSGKAKGTPI